MEFLKAAYLGLILPILGVFLAFCLPAKGMETAYGNLAPQSSWIGIPMNGGKSISVPAYSTNPVTLWTDSLKGCVVTIIKLEHHNGDQTVAMCHFAHYAKNQNLQYLNTFVNTLAVNTIKKASCIIIPPGVSKLKEITPILDKEWEQIIIESLCSKIPEITITINPYLFNVRSSCVKYTLDSSRAKGAIINLSREFDQKNKNILLECHNQEIGYDYTRLVGPLLATAAFVGFFIYNSQ